MPSARDALLNLSVVAARRLFDKRRECGVINNGVMALREASTFRPKSRGRFIVPKAFFCVSVHM